MSPILFKAVHILAFSAFFAGQGFSSPASSKLLPLVPAGVEVVGGFQDQASGQRHGRLLLTTRNNRLDLEDWQALTGSDSQRVLEEVIEVAASTPAGNLGEHLLLVWGKFDRERIFRSLELNGAKSMVYEGQPVRLIAPFARERGDMLDTRWLLILDNHIGMLGTPGLVKRALRRYADHAVPDSVLEERLSLLRSDVSSWTVMSSTRGNRNIFFAQPHSAWADLQQDADLLSVAVRFGSKVRIDFSVYSTGERDPAFFTEKASLFTDTLYAGPQSVASSPSGARSRFDRLSVAANHIEGSVELSKTQFEAWCTEFTRVRMPQIAPVAHGD